MMTADSPFSWRARERVLVEQEQAGVVAEIARVARGVAGFEGVFRAVMDVVGRSFGFAVGVLALVDDEDGVELVTLAARPVAAEVIDEAQRRTVEALLDERRRAPFAQVTQVVYDAAGLGESVGPVVMEVAGFAAAPALVGGRVTGLLGLAGADVAPAAWQLLEQLASITALVCEHSRLRERVHGLSVRDGLTGIFCRRHVSERLAMEFERARRHKAELSVVMVDVDRMAAVNAEAGFAAGGVVLREMARRLAEDLRGSDAIGRYAGDQFVIVLPHTPEAGALVVAERARRLIEETPFPVGSGEVWCTVSVGVVSAACPRVHGAAGLVYEAEQAMLAANAAGGNRVEPAR